MSNPFTAVENALVSAGKFLVGAAAKVESLIAKAEKLEPATASAIATLVSDTESLIALAAPAVGAQGLNFAVDSAAYAQFLKVKADLVALATVIASDVKAL